MGMNLAEKLEKDEIHARLLNWGRWLRYDNTFAKLGYPCQAPFVFSPRKGATVADLDAIEIEFVVSSLHLGHENHPEICKNGLLYAFILKIEYAERPDGKMKPASERAKDVSQKFKRPCAENTYYQHLAKARLAVKALAGPVL